MFDNNKKAFFALLRAGLWEKDLELRKYGTTDYSQLLQLATEQSVVGLVAAGLEHVKDVKVPQEWALQFAGQTIQLEQRNKAMNAFVAELIMKLRKAGVDMVLVKGQGIAQCYARPLWRACGDVDLLLIDDNYQKASTVLKQVATSFDEENEYNRHQSMAINGWTVELHGTIRSGLWKSLDKEIDDVRDDVFFGGKVRSWMNEKTQIFLPGVDEDVFIVFAHILQHYFQEGIGLRQICDWCRLLWTYRKDVKLDLLEKRLTAAGILTEWNVFGSLAVEYLGVPKDVMPFFDEGYKDKGKIVMNFILETGNMGHNRDYSYQERYSYIASKAISVWKHIEDFFRYVRVFPLDAVKVLWSMMIKGIIQVAKGR